MATDAFARDLGYLGQFFDKLEAHAATLGPEAGARLRALIGEERTRWVEIRALVGGAEASEAKPSATPSKAKPSATPSEAKPTATPSEAKPTAPKPTATPSAPSARPQKSETRTPLTVGSLIGRD